MAPRRFADLVATTVPSLEPWRRRWEHESLYRQCSALADEIIERQALAELRALAPVIEDMLRQEHDEDAVELLVEELLHAARDGQLDAARTRQALGPLAGGTWDHLYQQERQCDLRAVEFTDRDLGHAPQPAEFLAWLVRSGTWVDPETPLATLSLAGQPAQLRVTARCYVDRMVTSAGSAVPPGSLLLYLAPWEPSTPKGAQLCVLAETPSAAV